MSSAERDAIKFSREVSALSHIVCRDMGYEPKLPVASFCEPR